MKRILIVGNCGSGKSVYAEQLGRVLSLPVIHLDRLLWTSEQKERSREEFERELFQVLQQKHWIIDGNYQRTFPQRLQYADTVIFLDYSRLLCLWRAVKRYVLCLRGARSNHGNPPLLRWKFLWRILTYPRREMMQALHGAGNVRVLIMKTPTQARQGLEIISRHQ